MLKHLISLALACAAGCSVDQPRALTTVAAYEVPLPTPLERERFLSLLSAQAKLAGYHVDAATAEELQAASEVWAQSMNATVWTGGDEETIASAMDAEDHLGRVWISFFGGDDPRRSAQFRETLLPALRKHWPQTAALPLTPDGVIPLAADLERTPRGYILKPSAAAKYGHQAH